MSPSGCWTWLPWWPKPIAAEAMADDEPPPGYQPVKIYHERQRLQLCLLHALNNLYQGETTFTRIELSTIARSLISELHPQGGVFSRMFNAHYNVITGNYDANVLMRALQTRQAELSFCDPRNGANPINLLEPRLIGFILNHRVQTFGFKGRHWTALKKIEDTWVDLDSYLVGPEPIGNDNDVRQFISEAFARGSEVMCVLRLPEEAARDTHSSSSMPEPGESSTK